MKRCRFLFCFILVGGFSLVRFHYFTNSLLPFCGFSEYSIPDKHACIFIYLCSCFTPPFIIIIKGYLRLENMRSAHF